MVWAVYAVRDTKLGCRVAIKFLDSDNQSNSPRAFILEARATARCSHEHIIVIHEVGEYAAARSLVLEYLSGAPQRVESPVTGRVTSPR